MTVRTLVATPDPEENRLKPIVITPNTTTTTCPGSVTFQIMVTGSPSEPESTNG